MAKKTRISWGTAQSPWHKVDPGEELPSSNSWPQSVYFQPLTFFGCGETISVFAPAREGADVAISYQSEEKDARETERLVIRFATASFLIARRKAFAGAVIVIIGTPRG